MSSEADCRPRAQRKVAVACSGHAPPPSVKDADVVEGQSITRIQSESLKLFL